MKYYITRYALTSGIEIVDAEISNVSSNMISNKSDTSSYRRPFYFHKPFWHETYKEALKHAEVMRIKKIISLKKQLAKYENLTFKEPQQ
jgi:hypothetical protein